MSERPEISPHGLIDNQNKPKVYVEDPEWTALLAAGRRKAKGLRADGAQATGFEMTYPKSSPHIFTFLESIKFSTHELEKA